MRHRVGNLLGDTLVEVTIAIGIFSMVAVAVVAVVSSGTSGSQSALENTVAREEIDAQAEALRFLQNSAVSEIGKDSNNPDKSDSEVWKAIASHAIDPSEGVLSYNVNECGADLYDNGTIASQKGFVINIRKLATGDPNQIVVPYSSELFKPTNTYPRVVYENDNEDVLLSQDTGTAISSVEGLYVIAVKNSGSGESATNIVVDGGEVKTLSAYYDFYIRSCWYSASSNSPTTISTVVRLYNPDVAANGITPQYHEMGYHDTIKFYPGTDEVTNTMVDQRIGTGYSQPLSKSSFNWPGYSFTGDWCTEPTPPNSSCSGKTYAADSDYAVPAGYTMNDQQNGGEPLKLYAMWKENPMVKIKFNKNSANIVNGVMNDQTVRGGTSTNLRKNNFSQTKYDFDGWCVNVTSCNSDKRIADKGAITVPADSDTTLYAQWKLKPANTITFNCGDGTAKASDMTQTILRDNPASLISSSTLCHAPGSNRKLDKWITSGCSALPSSYGEGATYTYNSSCNAVTLTAQWKPNLPATKTVVTGSTDSSCEKDIFVDSEYVTGTTHVAASRWYSQGSYSSGVVSFHLDLGGYSKARVSVKAGTNSPACESETWQKFDNHYWKRYGDWYNESWGGWCNSQGSNANSTYTITESGDHTLQAGGYTEHSGTWSNSCIVVTNITLSGVKE